MNVMIHIKNLISSKFKISICFIASIVLSFIIYCEDPGSIKVTNDVPGVTLEKIKWGSNLVSSQLLPGESGTAVLYEESSSGLGKTYPVTFYMKSKGAKVFLKTVKKYKVKSGSSVKVKISETTNVENPLND